MNDEETFAYMTISPAWSELIRLQQECIERMLREWFFVPRSQNGATK